MIPGFVEVEHIDRIERHLEAQFRLSRCEGTLCAIWRKVVVLASNTSYDGLEVVLRLKTATKIREEAGCKVSLFVVPASKTGSGSRNANVQALRYLNRGYARSAC